MVLAEEAAQTVHTESVAQAGGSRNTSNDSAGGLVTVGWTGIKSHSKQDRLVPRQDRDCLPSADASKSAHNERAASIGYSGRARFLTVYYSSTMVRVDGKKVHTNLILGNTL